MNKLDRIERWMRGVGHARGFGVQSPTAYRFVRGVICAPEEKVEEDELRGKWSLLDRRKRHACELYRRIARHVQPELTIDFDPDSEAYADYLKAGCRKTVLQRIASGRSFDDYEELTGQLGTIDLARISLMEGSDRFVELALNHVSEKSVFIIEDIWHDDISLSWWDELRQDERVSVTYDLYSCGLLTFDKKLFKRTYILNL